MFLTVKNVGSEMVQESFSTKVYSTVKLNVFLRIMRIWHAASMQRGHHGSLHLKGCARFAQARIKRIQPEDDLASSEQCEKDLVFSSLQGPVAAQVVKMRMMLLRKMKKPAKPSRGIIH